MTTMRWFLAGASPRGIPASRRPIRRHPVVLLALAVVVLSQTGCQSGFFGSCNGPCGGRLRNLSERAFRPFRGVGPCCNGDIGAPIAPGLQYGSPSVVSPGMPITPVSPIPPGATSSPATESLPSQLEPIPSATPAPANGDPPTQGAKASTGKANYEAFKPSARDRLNQSLNKGPEPTIRSAQGSARSQDDPNPLDHLPPLDIPSPSSRADLTPPVAPAAGPTALKASEPPPAAESLNELAGKAAAGNPEELTVVPGIRRFSGVEAKLSGGSMPTTTGLDWLAEKGYKTVLDLREESEITPAFIADVTRRGMRYVALPITSKTVDADHVSRFLFELSVANTRPLYFFDREGTRASVMWFIRRVSVDHVDPQVARRDAEELGLSEDRFWQAANVYLEGIKPTPAPAPAKPAAKLPASAPVGPAKAPLNSTQLEGSGGSAPQPQSAGPASAAVELANPPDPRDSTAWKPIAALVVTGLSIPLAYVSRATLPASVLSRARASLPGPRRSPKSLPGRWDG